MQLDPDSVLDLVNSLRLWDYMCTINSLYHLAKISKFIMLIITYQESAVARNLSSSRSHLERCPLKKGSGVQPAAVQESSRGPGLSAIHGVRRLNYRDIDIQQKMWFTIPASPWFPHCSPSPLRSRTSWMELSQPHWWLWPTGRQLGRSQEQRALQGQGWLLPRQEHPGARRSSPGSALTKHSPRESGQDEHRWILVSLHSASPGS